MNTRRQFCADACHAAFLASALGPLAACGGGGGETTSSPSGPSSGSALSRLTATQSGNQVTLTIDGSSPLASVGGAAFVTAGSTQLLIARTGAGAFSALTAICTHEACSITGFANSRYVCPCHGSTFDTSGGVVLGPASTPLRAFTTTFSGTTLVVTL